MKKFILFAFAAASMLLSGACQKENGLNDGDFAEVTLSVDLPDGLSTKSIGDGSVATDLYYGVFSQEKTFIHSLKQPEVIKMANNKATLKLKLVRNYTYTIVCWAQSPQATYYKFDAESGVVNVDYKGNANDENRDAFCGVYTFDVPDAATFDGTIYLKRPFAQINFGADDFAPITELGLTMKSTIKVEGLANVYDILNGKISSEPESGVESEFVSNTVPAQFSPVETLKVGDKEYGYVSMNYILAPVNEYDKDGKVIVDHKELANVSATFSYNGKDVTVDVPNVPYQRNFRTNIVGTLFTSEVDLDIVVVPAFHEKDIEVKK